MKRYCGIVVFCLICFFAAAGEDYDEMYDYLKIFTGHFETMVNSTLEVESADDLARVIKTFKAKFEDNLHLYVIVRTKYGNEMYETSDDFPPKVNKLIEEFTEFTRSENFLKAGEIIQKYSDDEVISALTMEIDKMMSEPEEILATQLDFEEVGDFLDRFYRLTEKTMKGISEAESSTETVEILNRFYKTLVQMIEEAEGIEERCPLFVFDMNMSFEHYDYFPEDVQKIIDEFEELLDSELAEKAEEKVDLFSEVEEVAEIIEKIGEAAP